jgi:hypothetical protein
MISYNLPIFDENLGVMVTKPDNELLGAMRTSTDFCRVIVLDHQLPF